MTLFEGLLNKWTNILKGWQTRYCVLDPTQGTLVYYTSRENGAHLGIDVEDDTTFTIRSYGKTFHFQARDIEERRKWLCNLEDTISFNTINTDRLSSVNTTLFQKRILEVDGILQILIDQVEELEEISNQRRADGKENCYEHIILSSRRLIESVKHSIVSLQLAKKHMDPQTETFLPPMNGDDKITPDNNISLEGLLKQDFISVLISMIYYLALNIQDAVENIAKAPTLAVSGSDNDDDDDDDDEFEDANDTIETPTCSPLSTEQDETPTTETDSSITFEQYEAAYEEAPEDDVAPNDGTIIKHIISQCSLFMDLTKITLPTFILERRSFLEMLADFLAHPDEFVNIADHPTPRERFIQVVKWYLSAFHAGRKSPVPKKPYNPILGEIFQCSYDIGLSSSESTLTKDGPVPWASDHNVTFIAEQTSHHPPIASFYAECPAKRIQLDGCLWTKSQFLGLSIGVHMVGDATITLLDYDERYVLTFPSAYGRNILLVPWFEMGGKVSITCEKTGYSANIEFLTKPFYNEKKHKITATLLGPDKKEFCKIDGEWNGIMNAKYTDAKVPEVFFDTKTTPIIKKIIRPIAEQDEHESRRMWKDVTYYLKYKQMDKATTAKSFLEQRQREDAKQRAAESVKWQTKYFTESGEQKWTYGNKLSKRIQTQS
ncbi:unnamed protein product [Adineta ricciae]|uniref:PH domain-containing protein n=1 Tax=Adineta ricciae TaxID=249248 RepID=A0A814ECQ1_ADIRI|nr:unnamed protein product [Adineta ricciae]